MNNLPKIADLESIFCRLPYSRQLTFAPLVDTAPSQFLCPYQTHCLALCHCCDYDACDCPVAVSVIMVRHGTKTLRPQQILRINRFHYRWITELLLNGNNYFLVARKPRRTEPKSSADFLIFS